MNHFWHWVSNKAPNNKNENEQVQEQPMTERTLILNGTIAEESWFDDEVTPSVFKDELDAGTGDITVWINSPGGDCFAAASIYNMLMDYKGKVTVKIDGLAASAASVIAMAGDRVLVTPVSMIMVHNPMTIAAGDQGDMQKAIEMLEGVKDSIINAYANKTGLSRNKLSKLMDDETWIDATKAVELGFADEIMTRPAMNVTEEENGETDSETEITDEALFSAGFIYSARQMAQAVTNKVNAHVKQETPESIQETRPSVVNALQNTPMPEEKAATDSEGPKEHKYEIKALEQRLLLMGSLIGTTGTGNKRVPNGTEANASKKVPMAQGGERV